MKEKGIILPVFSLPSKYGIGDFGTEAYEFIDILSQNNIKYWEILPICACDKLPYAPQSYYALNEDYISLDKLKEHGLIKNARVRRNTSEAIYDNFKEKYFEEAYTNFKKNEEFVSFIENEEIKKYADYKSRKTGIEAEYYLFLQYILYKQWKEIKEYANNKNVEIIGDMPIYPAFESAETENYPQYFEMENGKFTFEAGTPPDFFSSTGQKWGTPVYNVKNLKRDGYKYLVDRYKYQLNLFDKIRIDHFLGYDMFYKIPFGKEGKDGTYEIGLGYGFFDELIKENKINKNSLIIEDLGEIRDETIKLREHYGFTGQRLVQSTINLENICDSNNTNENIMILPGNHDCPTIKSWYNSLNKEEKENLKEFLKINNCSHTNINTGIMQYCMKCKAKIVMVTVQDILEEDDRTRINIPGTEDEENWTWKLKNFNKLKKKIKCFRDM